eukprot:TRINITY_DN91916_c0_g1_i1.p1 TRINITY_DN91916_c0_g1~~TRINITY_DN91916_c0_g1_i1.p1  ORF type:complete len:186 (+),score=37.04 TRINITY_DN91916_c0_g1_i1:56-559(+)
MPLVALYVKAEMDGVDKLVFPQEEVWKLDVKQSSSEEMREGVTLDPTNEEEVPNSKGTANFLIKWEGAKAPSTITMMTPSRKQPIKDLKDAVLGEYTGGGFQPVAVFDCRGAEPCRWYPLGVTIETPFGKFENVDLTNLGDEEWMEASETGECATISELKFEFRVVK